MTALQPLSHGNILLVGVKASNLSDEIRNHPRVIVWDSQQEHWTNKDIPSNVRVVFTTRFIGHTPFAKIRSEAVKRHLTMFNPEGTGQIVKQVKELLNMTLPAEFQVEYTKPQETKSEIQETNVTTPEVKTLGKLKLLIPYIDLSKSGVANVPALMEKVKELGFTSTPASIANFVNTEKRKILGGTRKIIVKKSAPTLQPAKLDVSVEVLDGAIKELQDVRAFLIAVTEENNRLKVKVDKFKKFFDE